MGHDRIEGDNGEKRAQIRNLLEMYLRTKSLNSLFELLDITCTTSDILYVQKHLWICKSVTLVACSRVNVFVMPTVFGRVFSNLRCLDMSNMNLKRLPEAIVECVSLKKIILQRNYIKFIDVQLGRLVNLQWLDLSDNQIDILPRTLASLTKLDTLDISRNQLFTMFLQPDCQERRRLFAEHAERRTLHPGTDWEEVLDPAKGCKVFYNKKTGRATNTKPNSLSQKVSNEMLPNHISWEIQKVEAPNSELFYNHSSHTSTYRVPDCLESVCNLSRLVILKMCGNSLQRLPRNLKNLVFLEKLDISENELIDVVPLAILARLVRLDLSKNRIKNVTKLCAALQYLDISHNCLDDFPKTIMDMKALSHLDLRFNNISSVPYGLGFLGLKSINLAQNPIIDPSYNLMIQSTEKVLWECKQLSKRCSMEGNPSVSLHVSGISVQRSSLLPDVESRILQLITEAIHSGGGLDLQQMNICIIPSQLFHIQHIRRIDLSQNPLVLIETCWTVSMTHLRQLILKSCRLKELPQSIENFSNLEYLHVGGNDLNSLPSAVTNLSQLHYLDVSNNLLVQLPHDIGRLGNLVEIFADWNRLEGIPDSITGCKQLEVISASHNNISVVKGSLSDLRYLRKLNLNRNFIKEIPSMMGKSFLVTLSLAFNQIDVIRESSLSPTMYVKNF